MITSIYFLAHLFSKQFLVPPEASPAFANATFAYSSEKPFDKLSPGMYFPFFTFVEFQELMANDLEVFHVEKGLIFKEIIIFQ